MSAFTRRPGFVALAAFVVFFDLAAEAGAARAADPTAIPPAPTEFVTDRAGFLSPAAASALSRKLEDYERGTGHQVIVWIDKTTGAVPIDDWAARAFKAWGVGRKGLLEQLERLVPKAYREFFPGKDFCADGHFYLHDGTAWSFFRGGFLDE